MLVVVVRSHDIEGRVYVSVCVVLAGPRAKVDEENREIELEFGEKEAKRKDKVKVSSGGKVV